MKALKILITGVGVTGKSSFREAFIKEFSEESKKEDDVQCEFIGIDGDYEKLPTKFKEDIIYVIEDVHATMNKRMLPLEEYDLIYYLIPSYYHHLYFWLNRLWRWFQNGYGSWDKHRSTWLGTGRPYDLRNIPPFCYQMLRDMWYRRKWINDDLEILNTITVLVYLVYPRRQKEINFSRKEILGKGTI